jgi:DNA-binding HxlR family transcriptional regulator
MSAETETRQHEIEAQNASACPVIQAIDKVGTPWRLNVIYALADGEQRFNELKEATNARSKTLSDALDELVENDVVTRRMEEAAPVAVYYRLTSKGEGLLDALGELAEWEADWEEEPPEGDVPRRD